MKMTIGPFQFITTAPIVFALGFAAVATLCAGAYAETRIILRMDDEGFGRHRDMESEHGLSDAAITQRVLQIIAKHDANLTIGVIPNVVCGSPDYRSEHPVYRLLSSAPEEVAVLRQGIAEGYAEVALHGWTHEALPDGNGHSSEFAGLPFEEQFRRLAEGKEELERCLGVPIDIFVPPFNNHDRETLNALRALNFACISSTPKMSDTVDGLFYVPYTTSLKALMGAELEALSSETPVVINAVFHAQDFRESGTDGSWMTFADLDGFLGRLSLHPGIEFTTIRNETQREGDAFTNRDSRLYALYKSDAYFVKYILDLVGLGGTLHQVLPSTEVLYPTANLGRVVILILCIEAFIDVVLFAAAAICAYGTLKFVSRNYWLRLLPSLVVGGAVSFLSLLFIEGIFGVLGTAGFGSRLILAASTTGGVLLGSFMVLNKKRRVAHNANV